MPNQNKSIPADEFIADDEKVASNTRSIPADEFISDDESGKNQSTLSKVAEFARAAEPGSKIPIFGPLAEKAGIAAGAGLTAGTNLIRNQFRDEGEEKLETDPVYLYAKAKEEEELAKKKAQEKYPVTSLSSSIAGSAALPGVSAIKGAKYVPAAAQRIGFNTGISYLDAKLRGQDAVGEAKTTAGISAAAEAIPYAGKVAGKFIPRFVFGVRPETAKRYKEGAARINQLDEEKVVEDLNAAIGDIRGSEKAAREALDEAKIEKKVADRYLREGLKKEQVPEEAINTVDEGLSLLRKQISQRSSDAFDVLEKTRKQVPIEPLKNHLENSLEKFKIAGTTPPPGDASNYQALSNVKNYLDDLSKQGISEFNASDAKRFVQYLDDQLEQGYALAKQPGGYVPRGLRELDGFRKAVDSELKKIPEYKKIMEPLAEKTKLASDLQGSFKDRSKSLSSLQNLASQKSKQLRESLAKLEKETGIKIFEPLRPYEEAQAALKDPSILRGLESNLPETKKLVELSKLYEDAARKADPIKGLSEKSAQSILKRVGGEKNPIHQRKMLEYLSEVTGKDFVSLAKDLGVKGALEQGFIRGSRNVNLGAFSLGGIAKGLSGATEMVPFGQAAGAVLGSMADIVGPKTYKNLVDISLNPKFKKYSGLIQDAYKKGPQVLTGTIRSLSEQDPEFAKEINK